MPVLAFTNLKGGSAKTTSTVGIAEAMARMGKHVLAVDLDPQATLSRWVSNRSPSASAILNGDPGDVQVSQVPLAEKTKGRLGVVTADRTLSAVRKVGSEDVANALRRFCGRMSNYEFILLDLPSQLGPLTVGALLAADGAVVPVAAGPGGLMGLRESLDVLNRLGAASLQGAFACRVDVRTVLDTQIPERLLDSLGPVDEGGGAFRPFIREAVAMREAQTNSQLPAAYDPNMSAVDDYRKLTTELLSLIPETY